MGPLELRGAYQAQWATQTNKIFSPFIGDEISDFHHVGLMCFTLFAGDVADRGASDQTCKKARIDLVDFGTSDSDQRHMMNARPSISLVKSNGYNLISQSVNRGVTCVCLWTLR